MENTVEGAEVKWPIQHKVKPSAVFDIRPHPEYFIFRTSQLNSALTDLLICIGRVSSSSINGSEM